MIPAYLQKPAVLVTGLCIISLCLHIFLITSLYVVEDESGYMQDAAQISWDVLPFREFGGTKGPVFLFVLKIWQVIFGQTIESSRMFSVVAHIISIPFLFFFARNITQSSRVGYSAAALWAIVPVVVGLTTNVMHIPLELLFILIATTLLTQPSHNKRVIIPVAAALFFLAVLTRATAAAFFPLMLLLVYLATRRWQSLLWFCLVGALLLSITVAIIYPLYGWPKTAFFFNADAVLIYGKQRAVYAATEQLGVVEAWFRAALPAWREGLLLMLAAFLFPCLWLAQRWGKVSGIGLWIVILLLFGRLLLDDTATWWSQENFFIQWLVARLTFFGMAILGIWILWQAHHVPRIATHVLIILGVWVSGFILFYTGWGRSPTPYYILESIPALAIAAAITLHGIWTRISVLQPHRYTILAPSAIAVGILALMYPYPAMSQQQYRGTLLVSAVKETATYLKEHMPEGEELFTGQPVFAYVSEHPLYGRYTHPGWYLSERAGYLPAEIRGVFLPDFTTLITQVQRDVNWIVVDWRTNDIYFNGGTEATAPLRTMLEEDFELVTTIKNPISRDILVYRRIGNQ